MTYTVSSGALNSTPTNFTVTKTLNSDKSDSDQRYSESESAS